MSVSFRKIINAVTPRSLEKWEKPLGPKRRAEIQMIQHTKHLFGLMNFVNISSKKETSELIQPLEEKIIRIQEDPEVNFKIEITRITKEAQSSLLKEQSSLGSLLEQRRKNQEQINLQTDAILQAPSGDRIAKVQENLPALKNLLFAANGLTEMIETGCNRLQAYFDLLKAIEDTNLTDVSPRIEKGQGSISQLFNEINALKNEPQKIQGILNRDTLALFSLTENGDGERKEAPLSPPNIYIGREVASTILIMLIDDDLSVLQTTKKYLEEIIGYKVTAFSEPQQALEAFKAQKPDLVLTDFTMPGMSGSALIEQMGSVPGTKSVRYAIYTANELKKIRRENAKLLAEQNVRLIGKGDHPIFVNEINAIAAQIKGINPAPATASKPKGADYATTLPLEFIERVVHKVGNSLMPISMNADFFIMMPPDTTEDLKPLKDGYEQFKSEVEALQAFAGSAPMLLEKNTAAETFLPLKLLDKKLVEIWEKTPPEARFKFALITSLYLEQSLADYLFIVEENLSSPTITPDNFKNIKAATTTFSKRSKASVVEDGTLADKYLIYYNLLK